MSIAGDEFQKQMLALGGRTFAEAATLALEQGAIDPQTHASAVGQIVMQSLLGHCERGQLPGGAFVHGVGYALGSLLAQVPPGAGVAVMTALSQGMEAGQADARRDFNTGGRA